MTKKLVVYAVVIGDGDPIAYWINQDYAENYLRYAKGARIARLVEDPE